MTTWDHTEPPRSFLLFSAMATLGAAIGRNIWYNYDGNLRVYPMLNLLLIGRSGVGKTIAIEPACKGILGAVAVNARPQLIVGAVTPEKLHSDLRGNPKTLILAPELAAFFVKTKYMETLIPYVTRLLDYADWIERRTLVGDLVRVDRPSVTIMGASTREWLQEQIPQSANEGGFLARFLIVSEGQKYQKVADPLAAMAVGELAQINAARLHVEQRMVRYAAAQKGEIGYSDQAPREIYKFWYDRHSAPSGHLAPFAARAGEFVRRLAMLLALSSERFAISADDMESAIALYTHATRSLQKIVVPYSFQGKLQNAILEAVQERPVSPSGLRALMLNFTNSSETDKLVASLISAQKIIMHDDGLYHPTEGA